MAELNGMQGNEIADYHRKSVPQGRWRDAWGVFKANFFKLVLLNIFVSVTFAPGIAIVYVRASYIQGLGLQYPFNPGVMYPFYPDVQGMAEQLYINADLIFYSLLIAAGLIASVGIAGAAYSIRKILLTHGEFSLKTFFHGVKVCYLNTVVPVTVFMLFMFSFLLAGDWVKQVAALEGNVGGAITAYVFIIIATVLVGLYLAWVLAVGTSYKLTFKNLLKNSLVLLTGNILPTIFMAGFALIPVWLLLGGGFWLIIALVFFIFIGFSFIILSWTSFTQWAFDLYIAPNVKTEKEPAKKGGREAAEREDDGKQTARELLAAGRSELIARPIMPISDERAVECLGGTFTRAGIRGAADSRAKLGERVAAYEKAHENDPAYAEYNKMFAEREKALKAPADKKKKKKISADNLLK